MLSSIQDRGIAKLAIHVHTSLLLFDAYDAPLRHESMRGVATPALRASVRSRGESRAAWPAQDLAARLSQFSTPDTRSIACLPPFASLHLQDSHTRV